MTDFGAILAGASGSPWVRTEYRCFQLGLLTESKTPPTYTKLTPKGHQVLARLAAKHSGFWGEIQKALAKDAASKHPADTDFAQIFALTTMVLHNQNCKGGKSWHLDIRYKGSGKRPAEIPCGA